MCNFTSIHSYAKKLYLHMSDIVDTAFSYDRKLIVCSFLQDISMGKGSSLQLIFNTLTAFLLCGAELQGCIKRFLYSLNVKEQKIRVKTISLEKSEFSLLNSEFSLSKSDIFSFRVIFF